MWCAGIDLRVVEVPVAIDLHVGFGGQKEMPRWDLEHPLEERAHLVPAILHRMIERIAVPRGGHSGSEERLHFGRDVERVRMEGIKQWLDAKPVARGKDPSVGLVPEHKGEFAPQPMQAVDAQVFIEMESDLAVRVRP